MTKSKPKGPRRKRKRKQKESPQTRIRRRLERTLPGKQIHFASAGETRMSQVLADFVAPYETTAGPNREAYRKLLAVAAVAWNAALLPKEERQQMIDEVIGGLPQDDRQLLEDARVIIAELIERKERHFAQYRRTIIDFELVDREKGYYLSVISTAEPLDSG